MNDWKQRTKDSVSRVYKAEGAPLQAWHWLLLGVGAYLLFKGTESIGSAVARITKGIETAVETILPSPDKALTVLTSVDLAMQQKGIAPTIQPSQITIMAQNLEDAFKSGFAQSTEDEDAILAEFAKLKNDRDFTQLFIAFGTRNFVIPGNSGNLLEYINEFTPEIKHDINTLLSRTAVKLRV